jgi:protein SDA1
MPIDLIYSPQDFSEKLFNLMNHKQTKFAHKLIYMSLISRIIWRHKLIMLPFYGALQKYMDPRQK